MNRLDEDRKRIDEIDQQMTALFEERFHVVEDVIAYKMENHMQVLDASREEVIEKKNAENIRDEKIRPYFRTCYREMLRQSRAYQEAVMKEDKKDG